MLNELWNSIRGRAVKPRVAPSFMIATGHDETQDDEIISARAETSPPDWVSALEAITGFSCVIIYRNSQGVGSQRLVTCQRQDAHGQVRYLWAYCHGRQAVRQFRLDRIAEVFDAQSGESLGGADAFFARFAINRVQKSAPGWGLGVRARAEFIALLNCLVFIAKCDRQFHNLEHAVIEDVIARYWLRTEAQGEPDIPAILGYIDRLAPDAETFFVSLERCSGKSMLARLLKDSVIAVVDADGRLAPEEVYWGSKIDEYFARTG